jgi:ribosome-associated toxin RatA of RatAB toxin-antitoxin module
MWTRPRWTALVVFSGVALAFGWSSRLPAADFALTEAETARIEKREIVIRAKLDGGERRGTVRAAMLIDAPPAVVFRQMTRCDDALEYVPHLRVCRVRSHAEDGTWQLVDHEVDFGWYAPRIRYTFRADLVPDHSIRFRQDHGDFKANEGIWEFEPAAGGARTLLRYRAYIDPPSFVPNWLARSKFKREMPQLLTELRRRCEAEQSALGPANAAH